VQHSSNSIEYCYLKVEVAPSMIEMNFQQVNLSREYVGMCHTEGKS